MWGGEGVGLGKLDSGSSLHFTNIIGVELSSRSEARSFDILTHNGFEDEYTSTCTRSASMIKRGAIVVRL